MVNEITEEVETGEQSVSLSQEQDNNNDEEIFHLLDTNFRNFLSNQNIKRFFPVQRSVIPVLLDDFSMHGLPPRDLCVSAPTGSGKTLCYVLPIVQHLSTRRKLSHSRIRALVVAPVVNLAKQVYEVFQIYAQHYGLKVCLLAGKQDFTAECENLYEKIDPNQEDGPKIATADVLVATPGRLLDHLRLSAGGGGEFCLKFLRFLVMDEADRLINDFRLDWLSEVERAVFDNADDLKNYAADTQAFNCLPKRYKIIGENLSNLIQAGRLPLQKILLSATLSLNAEQLEQLSLFQPRYFNVSVHGATENFLFDPKISIPQTLREFYVKSESKFKPLIVYLLIEKFQWKKVLCFVPSIDTSRRLTHVFKYMMNTNMNSQRQQHQNNDNIVAEVTSGLQRHRVNRILARFSAGKIKVLVCSDLMARGMDIEKIDCVLNYDCPKSISKYVHRIGRTARAGAEGTAVTLVEVEEFNKYRETFGRDERWEKIQELSIASDEMKKFEEDYTKALKELQTNVEAQKVKQKKRKSRLLKQKRPNINNKSTKGV